MMMRIAWLLLALLLLWVPCPPSLPHSLPVKWRWCDCGGWHWPTVLTWRECWISWRWWGG